MGLQCPMLPDRVCSDGLSCGGRWTSINGTTQRDTDVTVCCPPANPPCPKVSTQCPDLVRSIDQATGCLRMCVCKTPPTLPTQLPDPTQFTISMTTSAALITGSKDESITVATDAPAHHGDKSSSEGSDGSADTTIWAIVVAVIFVCVFAYAYQVHRKRQFGGRYDLHHDTELTNQTSGRRVVASSKTLRQSLIDLNSNAALAEDTSVEHAVPVPATSAPNRRGRIVETRVDDAANLKGPVQSAGLSNSVSDSALALSGDAEDSFMVAGAMLGGGGNVPARIVDDPSKTNSIAIDTAREHSNAIRITGLPSHSDPSVTSWTPGFYHNPDARQAVASRPRFHGGSTDA